MKQAVHLVQARDGVNLAWAEMGTGLPLVKAATWLTHVQQDLASPVWRHWIEFLGGHYRFIRYDERGCGLTDRNVGDLSFPRWVEDLEDVVDAAGVDRPFALLGISQGAATAIAYAVRHPGRVSHLVLYGGYALGVAKRADPEAARLYRAVQEVVRVGWGSDNPAFRQVFTSRFIPGGTPEQFGWFNDLCMRTASAETAHALLEARGTVDVRDQLQRVRCPTLVLHANGDEIAPLSEGRYLASHIPGAEFVALDSRNHVLMEDEPAWQDFRDAVLSFTGQEAGIDRARAAGSPPLTPRERAVLSLLCQGQSNAGIAWSLGTAEKTVRNHVSRLYRKIGVRSRAEAIVHAHRTGLSD